MNKMFERNVPETYEILKKATVGIAGCGGLGSNVATSLARAGVGKFILVDMDQVEISNLNRQYYFQDDIGLIKVEALKKHLFNINPNLDIITHHLKLDKDNYLNLFKDINILIEAFDQASEKKWIIEGWMKNRPDISIIAGSGLSGIGDMSKIKVERSSNLILCGDQETEMNMGLMAPKVIYVANLQACMALEELLK